MLKPEPNTVDTSTRATVSSPRGNSVSPKPALPPRPVTAVPFPVISPMPDPPLPPPCLTRPAERRVNPCPVYRLDLSRVLAKRHRPARNVPQADPVLLAGFPQVFVGRARATATRQHPVPQRSWRQLGFRRHGPRPAGRRRPADLHATRCQSGTEPHPWQRQQPRQRLYPESGDSPARRLVRPATQRRDGISGYRRGHARLFV